MELVEIKNKIQQLLKNRKISRKELFTEDGKCRIDYSVLCRVKKGEPVRLLGLRFENEERRSGRKFFAHIVKKAAESKDEYFFNRTNA